MPQFPPQVHAREYHGTPSSLPYVRDQMRPPQVSYQAQAHLGSLQPQIPQETESQLEPAIAVLQSSLKWERQLFQERKISRGLNQLSFNLQNRLHHCENLLTAKDSRIRGLEDENRRLCEMVNNTRRGTEVQTDNSGNYHQMIEGGPRSSSRGPDTAGTQDVSFPSNSRYVR
jgi:hypothetical protein